MTPAASDCADPVRTQEDHTVWREYLRVVDPGVCNAEWKFPSYCEGIAALAPVADRIPTLPEINRWLAQIGWQAAYSSGFVPAQEYAGMQARRIFPIARQIRRLRDFSHSAAPDFLHDVFGHLPMLFEAGYGDLVTQWAAKRERAAANALDEAVSQAQNELIAARELQQPQPALIEELTRKLEDAQAAAGRVLSRAGKLDHFYTWSMEFGLLNQGSHSSRILGGAVLSSLGELTRTMTSQIKLSRFQLSTLERPVNYTVFQQEMFTVTDFAEYLQILESV